MLLGGLSLITSSRTQGGGNILINNSSVNNIYPMDCDPPSIISLSQQPSIQMTLTPSASGSSNASVNVINQRYLQQFIRYNAPLSSNSNHNKQQTSSSYAPASLPIDVINFSTSGTGNNNSSTSMVLPDHHLNSSSLIINSNSGGSSFQHSGYAPFSLTSNEATSIQLTSHGNKGSTGSSVRSGNISNSGNAATSTTGDESMVGVCVQQSPVVIHWW